MHPLLLPHSLSLLSNGQWAVLSPGVMWLGLEVDQCVPSSAEINVWSYTFTPPIHFHGMVLN